MKTGDWIRAKSNIYNQLIKGKLYKIIRIAESNFTIFIDGNHSAHGWSIRFFDELNEEEQRLAELLNGSS